MRVKAAVLHEENKPLAIEEIELQPPKRGEVLIKVGAAGICRSDLHFIKGEAPITLPAILGHEGSGTVEAVGEGVTMVKPGDRVILSFVPNCGFCHYCETGRPHLCDTALSVNRGVMMDGTSRHFTASGKQITNMGKVSCFAERTVAPESGCIPVAEDFPLENAALVGCSVTTGVGAVLFNAKVQPGSSVAVVGCGGVGLNVIQGARIAGATTIIAVDVQDPQLDFACRFGATHSVNASREDAVARVRQITQGGVDYAFEAFGGGETTNMAVEMTRKGGTAVIVGLAPVGDKAPIEAMTLTRLEKTIKGCYYGSSRPRQDMPRLVELYRRGVLDIDHLVARRYSLDQINGAFADLDSSKVGRGVIVF
ncbi:MAG: Zn-dependent alcohol dehydrogenase [Chloroflexi bacterium]|nr:Zn-dependent alcohol dehydrogenase [Chloroflexota bacterium]